MNRRIRIGSITYAQKGRRALLASGIRARIVKLDSGDSAHGCVYGIELPEDKMLDAVGELRRLGIDYRFVDHDLF